MPRTAPQAPTGLGPRAKKLWTELNRAWTYSPDELELLKLACEACDRAHKAQALLDAEGVVVRDRFGQLKEHPGVQIRTAAETSAARLLKQLGYQAGAEREARNLSIRSGVLAHHSKKRGAR